MSGFIFSSRGPSPISAISIPRRTTRILFSKIDQIGSNILKLFADEHKRIFTIKDFKFVLLFSNWTSVTHAIYLIPGLVFKYKVILFWTFFFEFESKTLNAAMFVWHFRVSSSLFSSSQYQKTELFRASIILLRR